MSLILASKNSGSISFLSKARAQASRSERMVAFVILHVFLFVNVCTCVNLGMVYFWCFRTKHQLQEHLFHKA